MDVAREYLQDSLNTSLHTTSTLRPSEVPEMMTPTQIDPQSSSSYTLANDQSVLSRNVDQWIRGNLSPTENTGVQGSRVATVQRSTLATSAIDGSSFWYMLIMMLPLFNSNRVQWRCTPSTILYTAELFLMKVGRLCSLLGYRMRRLAQRQLSRDVFATAMDIVLVIYAIGFLILSMYQNSFTGV
ncbi:unnamed protein product, partial [Brenthis ino]